MPKKRVLAKRAVKPRGRAYGGNVQAARRIVRTRVKKGSAGARKAASDHTFRTMWAQGSDKLRREMDAYANWAKGANLHGKGRFGTPDRVARRRTTKRRTPAYHPPKAK